MKTFFQNLHYQSPPFWLQLFSPLTACYHLAISLRLLAYRLNWIKPTRVSVPVLSIGNLTTGGTGKTPIIQALSEDLIAAGYKVVILSRGYGAKTPQEYAQALSADYGDEAFQIQQALPLATVIVGKNRALNAQRAVVDYKPDVILLDDGFQYIRLHRDLNILLIDGDKQFGNRCLLPLGPLREPISQLKRANLIWVTKMTHPSQLANIEHLVKTVGKPGTSVCEVPFIISGLYHPATQETLPVDGFLGKKCILVSGIAHPTQFELDARSAGLNVLEHLVYEDHHKYSAKEGQLLAFKHNEYQTAYLADRQMHSHEPLLLTTDKDWVKISQHLPIHLLDSVYIVKVRPVLTEFLEIFSVLGKIQPYAPQPLVSRISQ